MIRLTDCLDMIIVADWNVKPQNEQTKSNSCKCSTDYMLFQSQHKSFCVHVELISYESHKRMNIV